MAESKFRANTLNDRNMASINKHDTEDAHITGNNAHNLEEAWKVIDPAEGQKFANAVRHQSGRHRGRKSGTTKVLRGAAKMRE